MPKKKPATKPRKSRKPTRARQPAPKPLFHELAGSLVDDPKPILQSILWAVRAAALRSQIQNAQS